MERSSSCARAISRLGQGRQHEGAELARYDAVSGEDRPISNGIWVLLIVSSSWDNNSPISVVLAKNVHLPMKHTVMLLKVVPRLFTTHPHSYNNDLRTTLWVTQRCFYTFQTFRRSTPSSLDCMESVVDLCRGQLRIPYNTIPLTKALIVETFGRIKTSLCHP